MTSFQVRFYQRTDQGRLRTLKVVTLVSGSVHRAMAWAAGVLEQTNPELLSRVVEVRVTMVETQAPATTPARPGVTQ